MRSHVGVKQREEAREVEKRQTITQLHPIHGYDALRVGKAVELLEGSISAR